MMGSATAAAVIFILAMAVTTFTVAPTSSPSALWPYHYVDIINSLGGGKLLSVHCISRDDDLGVHNLAGGVQYEFKFRLSLLAPTKFTCNLAPDGSHHANFTAFTEETADYNEINKHTYWIAKDDGIYLKRKNKEQDERSFDWDVGQIANPNRKYD